MRETGKKMAEYAPNTYTFNVHRPRERRARTVQVRGAQLRAMIRHAIAATQPDLAENGMLVAARRLQHRIMFLSKAC